MKKKEKDVGVAKQLERPILTDGIGQRISGLVEPHGAKKRLSDETGISLSQLDRYINETSSPTIEPLAQIAQASGVCLEWLATGKGPKHLGEREAQRFDVETLQQAVQVLETRLELRKGTMAPEGKAEMVASIYQLLIDKGGDEKSRASLILQLLSLNQ